MSQDISPFNPFLRTAIATAAAPPHARLTMLLALLPLGLLLLVRQLALGVNRVVRLGLVLGLALAREGEVGVLLLQGSGRGLRMGGGCGGVAARARCGAGQRDVGWLQERRGCSGQDGDRGREAVSKCTGQDTMIRQSARCSRWAGVLALPLVGKAVMAVGGTDLLVGRVALPARLGALTLDALLLVIHLDNLLRLV